MLHYEVKHEDLIPYFNYARRLLENFESVTIKHVPRVENSKADALSKLVTTLTVVESEVLNGSLYQRWIAPPVGDESQEINAISVYLIDEDW